MDKFVPQIVAMCDLLPRLARDLHIFLNFPLNRMPGLEYVEKLSATAICPDSLTKYSLEDGCGREYSAENIQ
jgi:hypothetical protein